MAMMQATRDRIQAEENQRKDPAAEHAALMREFAPEPMNTLPFLPLPEPLPPAPYAGPVAEVGENVRYYGRPGDYRAGRIVFPALVLKSDPATGECDLAVFFDGRDSVDQERVKPRVGADRGWEPVGANKALAERVEKMAAMLQLLGECVYGADAIVADITLLQRIERLEGIAEPLGLPHPSQPAKRGPGRPPKPKA